MSELSLSDVDLSEVLQRLTLHALKLFGAFTYSGYEPVLKGHGDGPEDLAMSTLEKFLNPEDSSVKWSHKKGQPTTETLVVFLKTVLRNDFKDLKRKKTYTTTVAEAEFEHDDEDRGMSLDQLYKSLETPEGLAIRQSRIDWLLKQFDDDEPLQDVLRCQLDPAGYQARTNQELAALLGTSVSDIENRKKRIGRRLLKLHQERAYNGVKHVET